MLNGIGEAGQQTLLNARVLVIGAGGLGSALISYLAAAGVGTIGIIDPDRVELSNLARQIIHETGDIGRFKVESASDRVAEINPGVKVVTYPYALDAANVGEIIGGDVATGFSLPLRGRAGVGPSQAMAGPAKLFLKERTSPNNGPLLTSPLEGEERARGTATAKFGYDLIADGCDNFGSRFITNAACLKLKKPLVSAAIAGFSGQVMTIAPHLAEGTGCYQCFVSADAPEANTCRESGIIGPLAGIIGSMQALEVINTILGKPALIGKLLRFDAHTMQQSIARLPQDAACPVCGA